MTSCHVWFTGPPSLLSPELDWPTHHHVKEPEESAADFEITSRWVGHVQRQNTVVDSNDASAASQSSDVVYTFMCRSSSWNRVKRVVAWMLRPRKVKVEQHSYLANRVLDADDLSNSLTRCITILQSQVFSEELKLIRSGKSLAMSSPLICVSPFIDSVGILRVGVRLSNSSLSYDARHPIILPSHHHVAKLIVHEFHLKWWHASTERTLAQLVQFFWMRAAVRSVVSQCVICRRFRAQTEVPFMSAHLPFDWNPLIDPLHPPVSTFSVLCQYRFTVEHTSVTGVFLPVS